MLRNVIPVSIIVLLANFAVWALVNQSVSERAWGGIINGLAYSGYQAGDERNRRSDDEIAEELEILSGQTASIRTYGVRDGLDRIPAIASRYGIDVNLGAWISSDDAKNKEELATAASVVRANPNVKRLIVGNEALLREDVSIDRMIDYLETTKRQIEIPVTTAEPWHIWLKYPQLAESVDFIAVHILPYWEGIPEEEAQGYLMYRYRQLTTAFPGKHIFIGEVGWPSEGQWVKGAEPSRINQAKFIRDFLNVASEERLDYSIIESFDQPWKRSIEGTVGAHWGLWDTNKKPKFSMSGSITESSRWLWGYATASFLALFPIQWFVRKKGYLNFKGKLFYALLIQAVASIVVWAILAAMAERILNSNLVAWSLLLGAQFVLLALLLVDGFELAEVLWMREKRRHFEPFRDWSPPPDAPKVSIHVPCYNEPPEMVKQTLDALAKLTYPNFEILIIDNNTKDEAIWKPVEAYCESLGPRFRFFHLPSWPGYKAGALNFALTQTAADAAIIGVIDSDYTVSPDWLRATVPYFLKPAVAFVQAPQDYRDGNESLFKRMCYWEYAGFFHIGMVQRNERNAIIQHGTMTLIRKTALQTTGGWSEWCICEDAELGLRLFENGYEAVYMNHSLGKGLMPDNFSAYKTQRFRWAYGAAQILKKHWNSLAEGNRLTQGQRYHFISGWLPWFADAAHIVFASASILWSGLLLLGWVEFPPTVFLIPTLSVFIFKIAAALALYHARVKCGWLDRLGAAVAGMGLSHAVARAMWQGMFTSDKPFFRTPKCAHKAPALQVFLMAREEIALLILLMLSAVSVLWTFEVQNRSAVLWTGMLFVQTLPYWAALCLACVNALPEQTSNPNSEP